MKRNLLCLMMITMLLLMGASGIWGKENLDDSNVSVANDSFVAYVPLDNRPINVARVSLLAKSIGYTIEIPEEDLFATHLDNQTLNQNGTQYGDGEQLLAWLKEMDAKGCDLFIISLDQMLYGGLVNSRVVTDLRALPEEKPEEKPEPTEPPEPSEPESETGEGNHSESSESGEEGENGGDEEPTIIFDRDALNKEIDEKKALYDRIYEVLTADPENKVFFLDTVMRLATTVEYYGYGSDYYNLYREYAGKPRQILGESDLTLNNIVKGYPYYSDGSLAETHLANPENTKLLQNHDSFLIQSYLGARERKLRLSDYVLSKENNGQFYYFIGVDDPVPHDNIQTNEKAYLSQKLGGHGTLFEGTDELGIMALTRLYTEERNVSVPIYLAYYGDGQHQVTSSFNTETLADVVTQHIRSLNGTTMPTVSRAAVHLYILTPPLDPQKKAQYVNDLIHDYRRNVSARIPTIIIDASGRNYGNLFCDKLIQETDLGYMLGYSNWNTWSNAVGIGLGQGITRYIYLTQDFHRSAEADRAFVQSLAFGFVKDIAYQKKAKYILDRDYSQIFGLNLNNFYSGRTDPLPDEVQTRLEQEMEKAAAPILENLSSSKYITNIMPYEEDGITSITLSDFRFPWHRTFEMNFEVQVGDWFREIGTHSAYIGGYPDGTFRAEDSISREEVAKMVAVADGLESGGYSGRYIDVSKNRWSVPYIEAVSKRGYFSGYGNGLFLPHNAMTRAEFAALVVKYAEAEDIPLVSQPGIFSDVSSKDWFSSAVDKAAGSGFIKGYGDGTFRPQRQVTRAEAVTMLNRLLGRDFSKETLRNPDVFETMPFSDVSPKHWAYEQILEAAIEHEYIKRTTE